MGRKKKMPAVEEETKAPVRPDVKAVRVDMDLELYDLVSQVAKGLRLTRAVYIRNLVIEDLKLRRMLKEPKPRRRGGEGTK